MKFKEKNYVALLPKNEMSAGYDILDAIIAFSTGSFFYQIWGFYVSYIYIIYTYIYMCVCVCVCVLLCYL